MIGFAPSRDSSRLRRLTALLSLATAVTGACAQKPVTPEVLHGPQGTTEVGLLDGAAYRIDIPSDWNHSLIVYYHGYAENNVTFHIAERLQGRVAPLLDRHFAIVQSGYSEPGWALQQAYPQTESLRRYFLKKYGQPRETYLVGTSMGGMLVTIALEIDPKPYMGGLDLCGSVGPTSVSFDRRFALRAAFDRYFPGIFPPLTATPPDYEQSSATREKIVAALKANPAAAASLRSLTKLHSDQDVAWNMDYYTFNVGDLQRRARGNPFDNRNLIYVGTGSTQTDADLNDHVRRYAATPQARSYLLSHYTPNGHIGKPLLALHTLYDPTVPANSLNLYNNMVLAAGEGQRFVQQYVHREGHCNFTDDQVGRAFDELVSWAHNGPRPPPGALPDPQLH
jgi:pimeloyl-ACP methyl ester carboxylesterase